MRWLVLLVALSGCLAVHPASRGTTTPPPPDAVPLALPEPDSHLRLDPVTVTVLSEDNGSFIPERHARLAATVSMTHPDGTGEGAHAWMPTDADGTRTLGIPAGAVLSLSAYAYGFTTEDAVLPAEQASHTRHLEVRLYHRSLPKLASGVFQMQDNGRSPHGLTGWKNAPVEFSANSTVNAAYLARLSSADLRLTWTGPPGARGTLFLDASAGDGAPTKAWRQGNGTFADASGPHTQDEALSPGDLGKPDDLAQQGLFVGVATDSSAVAAQGIPFQVVVTPRFLSDDLDYGATHCRPHLGHGPFTGCIPDNA